MELKDFVRESLVQISNAVVEANSQLEGTGALVNPSNVDIKNQQQVFARYMTVPKENKEKQDREPVVLLFDFDVAVHAEDSKKKGGDAGIAVSVLKLGGKRDSKTSSGRESRISFSIPVLLPRGGFEEVDQSG